MAGVGGKRAGAGRPKGSASKKTREIADAAAKAGITPLEVILEAMRELYSSGDKVAAAAIAKDAAPYVHPRLSSVELDATVRRDPIDLTDHDLAMIAANDRRNEKPTITLVPSAKKC